MANPSSPRPADPQRAARLDARLALYAQYASLVGDEVAAAWSDDPTEAGALTRQLARTRAALAEQYDELRGAPADPAAAGGFGVLFADAVTELDHQRAVDEALRVRLDAARFGAQAALGAGEEVAEAPVGGAPETGAPETGAPETGAPEARASEATPADGIAPLGGALVAARSSGVGGTLAGQYPGIVAGVDPTLYAAAPDAGVASAGRLDVRF